MAGPKSTMTVGLNKHSMLEMATVNINNNNLQNLKIMKHWLNFKEIDNEGDRLCLTRIAIMNNNKDIFHFLVNEGCDIYSISKDYQKSLIHFAASEGHTDFLKLLLEKAEKDNKYLEVLSRCDKDKNKASHYAAKYGRLDFLNYLKYQCFQGSLMFMEMNNNLQTPLELYINQIDIHKARTFCLDLAKEAILSDYDNLLNFILEKINTTNIEILSLIKLSTDNDKTNCLLLLLNKIKYQINDIDDSFLDIVIQKQKPKSLKLLLNLITTTISEEKINSLIVKTIRSSDHNCLNVIFNHYKISVNKYLNSNNDTAAIIAIKNQKIYILDWLANKKGCDMKIENKDGKSAFSLAEEIDELNKNGKILHISRKNSTLIKDYLKFMRLNNKKYQEID